MVNQILTSSWLVPQLQVLSDKCQQLSLKETMERQMRIREKRRLEAAEAGLEEGAVMEGVEHGEEGDDAGAHGEREEEGVIGGGEEQDMEDMFSGRPKQPRAPLATANAVTDRGGKGVVISGTKGKENKGAAAAAAAAASEAAAVPVGPKPKMHEDYPGWLKYQKHAWKQARGERKRRRAELQQRVARGGQGTDGGQQQDAAIAPEDRTNVGAMLRRRAAAVTAVPWQLLHLAETQTPGRFKVIPTAC